MELTERDTKRFVLLFLVALLAVLAFFIVRPVLLSVVAGLILAYVFFPVYKRINRFVKYKTLSAAIVSIFVLAIVLLPIWFLTPLVIQQMFQVFQLTQSIDVPSLLSKLLPGVAEQTRVQISIMIDTALSNLTSSVLNALVEYVVNFAVIALHIFLVSFVFFFTLRDEQKLREFVSGLSPLNKTQEEKLVKQFKDMTDSIVNGQIVAGILQGVLAGLAFLVFGVPNALVLTILCIVMGVIPILGPGVVYLPVAIFLYINGSPAAATIFLVYNVVIVSSVDNLIRAHLISKKTQLSQALVVIGMIGGLFVLGILGLILGPLIIGYFITFLKAYKEKTLSSFFGD